MKFEKGDKVIRVAHDNLGLVTGRTYVVSDLSGNKDADGDPAITLEGSGDMSFENTYFKLCPEWEKIKKSKLYKLLQETT